MKKAFITGITGQDGSYLCELLLAKGYCVHGLVHRPDALMQSNIGHLVADHKVYKKTLFLSNGSFEDHSALNRIIEKARPDEFYHLAAQSSPRLSLEMPATTLESIGMRTVGLLEILRDMDHCPRFLLASSSEIFGSPPHAPQDEFTPVNPSTPYGAAKAVAQQMTKIYRTSYRLPVCSVILFNHESPRRSTSFVSRKISHAVANIKLGRQKELQLGNLSARRDWGWAPNYVEGMWRMLQNEPVDDYVLASGKLHSVEEMVEFAFASVGLNWRDYVRHDPNLMTVVEPVALSGNPAKARQTLGWGGTIPLAEIMQNMVEADLKLLQS